MSFNHSLILVEIQKYVNNVNRIKSNYSVLEKLLTQFKLHSPIPCPLEYLSKARSNINGILFHKME
jgi:hypothetical protein